MGGHDDGCVSSFCLPPRHQTVLIRKVGQSLREARDSLAEGRSDPFASRDKKLSSMTLTLIVTSVAFLLLTSPIVVYTIWYGTLAYEALNDVRMRATIHLASNAGLLLWYTNLGINFYLYCLTGARYRAEFVRLVGCGGSSGGTLPQGHRQRLTVLTTTTTAKPTKAT